MSTRSAAAFAAAIACLTLAGAPAYAHHSIQAVVDTSKTVQGEMVLTKVDWVNPHAWFHFNMTKSDGSVAKDVMVEWMGLSGLHQLGYSAETFIVGRTFRVAYNPNRDGSLGGHLVTLVDETSGHVFGRANVVEPPPPPPPPRPQLRPVTNAKY
jgi:Family of unknown function (DUF6152)